MLDYSVEVMKKCQCKSEVNSKSLTVLHQAVGVIRPFQCIMSAIKKGCIGKALLLYQGLHTGQFHNKVKICVNT